MTSLPPPQKVMLFVVTFLLIGAAFYFLKYQDQLDTVARLKRELAQQEQRLVTLKSAAAKVSQLEKELAQSEEELSVLLTLLPDQKEIPGLLENISRLGSKVGLENILFQPQAEVPREFYAAIPIRLDLLGTYNDFGVFLDSVSKLNRILRVESVTMNRQRDKQLLQVQCTMSTYRFLETPVVPKGPAAPAPVKKK
jgi:type IV pilus assembly protein PilO